MEVHWYHIRPYIVGIFPYIGLIYIYIYIIYIYICGRYLQFRILDFPLILDIESAEIMGWNNKSVLFFDCKLVCKVGSEWNQHFKLFHLQMIGICWEINRILLEYQLEVNEL